MQWLDVIGIGEDGYEGLSSAARDALDSAELLIGGNRHHGLAPHLDVDRVHWTQPFSEMVATVTKHRPRKTALMVTGDPLWYSAGAKLLCAVPFKEVRFHPHLSAFQLACVRMGWSLADIETLTVHGRPIGQLIPYLWPDARLAVLTGGGAAVPEIAKQLVDRGYGQSEMTVLAAMGGPNESRQSGKALDWVSDHGSSSIPDFHTLCIECHADNGALVASHMPGLPDDVFETDGNFTKQEVRAVTVSMLAPRRGQLLWDVGVGSGTVAIEWMRAVRDSRAIGIDRDSKRLDLAKRNAHRLGAPRLELICGEAPAALHDLPNPDAVFLGGGISEATIEFCLRQLNSHGRLVANAVTVESENMLTNMHQTLGGALIRMTVASITSLGEQRRGWQNQMTVTQWRYYK